MKLQNYISSFSNVEAYDTSTFNCFAFRHGYDVRQGLSLSLGKILMACKQALEQGAEPPIDYVLLQEAHINLLGRELTFNQYVNQYVKAA